MPQKDKVSCSDAAKSPTALDRGKRNAVQPLPSRKGLRPSNLNFCSKKLLIFEEVSIFALLEPAKPLNDAQMCGSFFFRPMNTRNTMDKKSILQYKSDFDSIVRYAQSDDGKEEIEVWYARELQTVLGYARWENFVVAIRRAVDSC